MKKILGINKIMQTEVPSTLDAKILAYAAIRQRQQKMRRRVRILLPAAAALVVLCAGAVAFLHLEERSVPSFKSSRLFGSASQVMMSYSKGASFSFESMAFSIISSVIKLAITHLLVILTVLQ